VTTHLPIPLSHAGAAVIDGRVYVMGGRTTGDRRVAVIWSFDPTTGQFHRVARLPYGVSDAGISVVGHSAYLVGGETPAFSAHVIRVRAVDVPGGATAQSGDPAPTRTASSSPSTPTWLAPATGRGHLAPGSDPSVLPGPILIADKYNNRLVIVDPQGRVRWLFPRPGDLPAGDRFLIPDDAFFSPDGGQIIATEEDDYVVSVIDPARHLLLYRYGVPGVSGSGPNRLDNPDDAFLLPRHDIVTADIKNCRVLHIRQGAAHATTLFGTTGSCYHDPPHHLGSPNGAFPMRNGDYLVTEIQGSWVDELTPRGRLRWSVRVPGVAYPSDANQLPNGRLLTVDYSTPGQVVIFGPQGHVFWRYAPTGAQMLRQPSLARPLPNGDVLITDDGNHRVIVVDPRTNRVVWQYGHTGVPGRGPGYLDHPDGLDLLPPDQLAAVMLRAH
jgi:DNA-binding beta-propeller fold protein YncE